MVELLVRRHATARGTGAAGVGVAIAVTGAVGDAEGTGGVGAATGASAMIDGESSGPILSEPTEVSTDTTAAMGAVDSAASQFASSSPTPPADQDAGQDLREGLDGALGGELQNRLLNMSGSSGVADASGWSAGLARRRPSGPSSSTRPRSRRREIGSRGRLEALAQLTVLGLEIPPLSKAETGVDEGQPVSPSSRSAIFSHRLRAGLGDSSLSDNLTSSTPPPSPPLR
jgi:hypothetical protein